MKFSSILCSFLDKTVTRSEQFFSKNTSAHKPTKQHSESTELGNNLYVVENYTFHPTNIEHRAPIESESELYDASFRKLLNFRNSAPCSHLESSLCPAHLWVKRNLADQVAKQVNMAGCSADATINITLVIAYIFLEVEVLTECIHNFGQELESVSSPDWRPRMTSNLGASTCSAIDRYTSARPVAGARDFPAGFEQAQHSKLLLSRRRRRWSADVETLTHAHASDRSVNQSVARHGGVKKVEGHHQKMMANLEGELGEDTSQGQAFYSHSAACSHARMFQEFPDHGSGISGRGEITNSTGQLDVLHAAHFEATHSRRRAHEEATAAATAAAEIHAHVRSLDSLLMMAGADESDVGNVGKGLESEAVEVFKVRVDTELSAAGLGCGCELRGVRHALENFNFASMNCFTAEVQEVDEGRAAISADLSAHNHSGGTAEAGLEKKASGIVTLAMTPRDEQQRMLNVRISTNHDIQQVRNGKVDLRDQRDVQEEIRLLKNAMAESIEALSCKADRIEETAQDLMERVLTAAATATKLEEQVAVCGWEAALLNQQMMDMVPYEELRLALNEVSYLRGSVEDLQLYVQSLEAKVVVRDNERKLRTQLEGWLDASSAQISRLRQEVTEMVPNAQLEATKQEGLWHLAKKTEEAGLFIGTEQCMRRQSALLRDCTADEEDDSGVCVSASTGLEFAKGELSMSIEARRAMLVNSDENSQTEMVTVSVKELATLLCRQPVAMLRTTAVKEVELLLQEITRMHEDCKCVEAGLSEVWQYFPKIVLRTPTSWSETSRSEQFMTSVLKEFAHLQNQLENECATDEVYSELQGRSQSLVAEITEENMTYVRLNGLAHKEELGRLLEASSAEISVLSATRTGVVSQQKLNMNEKECELKFLKMLIVDSEEKAKLKMRKVRELMYEMYGALVEVASALGENIKDIQTDFEAMMIGWREEAAEAQRLQSSLSSSVLEVIQLKRFLAGIDLCSALNEITRLQEMLIFANGDKKAQLKRRALEMTRNENLKAVLLDISEDLQRRSSGCIEISQRGRVLPVMILKEELGEEVKKLKELVSSSEICALTIVRNAHGLLEHVMNSVRNRVTALLQEITRMQEDVQATIKCISNDSISIATHITICGDQLGSASTQLSALERCIALIVSRLENDSNLSFAINTDLDLKAAIEDLFYNANLMESDIQDVINDIIAVGIRDSNWLCVRKPQCSLYCGSQCRREYLLSVFHQARSGGFLSESDKSLSCSLCIENAESKIPGLSPLANPAEVIPYQASFVPSIFSSSNQAGLSCDYGSKERMIGMLYRAVEFVDDNIIKGENEETLRTFFLSDFSAWLSKLESIPEEAFTKQRSLRNLEAKVKSLVVLAARKASIYCVRVADGASASELLALSRVKLCAFMHEDEPWKSLVDTPKNFSWARLLNKDPSLIDVCVPLNPRGGRRTLLWNSIVQCHSVSSLILGDIRLKPFRGENLDLSGYGFGSAAIRPIIGLLGAVGKELKSIDLRKNNLGGVDGRRIASAIDVYCKNLTYICGMGTLQAGQKCLDLSGHSLSDNFQQGLLAGILISKRHCANLTSLKLNSCDLGHNGIVELTGAISCHTSLVTFGLGNNGLGPLGLRNSLKAFHSLKLVTVLCLKNNEIGPRGSSALAILLNHLVELIILDISGNNIGAAGGLQISTSISRLRYLQELNISSNQLGSGGAGVLVSYRH